MADDLPPDAAAAARFERLMSVLRHDLRGILSPALLAVDRLADYPDPAVQRAGGIVGRCIERAVSRLAETASVADSARAPRPEAGHPAVAAPPDAPAPLPPPGAAPPKD